MQVFHLVSFNIADCCSDVALTSQFVCVQILRIWQVFPSNILTIQKVMTVW